MQMRYNIMFYKQINTVSMYIYEVLYEIRASIYLLPKSTVIIM